VISSAARERIMRSETEFPAILTWMALIVAATFAWSLVFHWSGPLQLLLYVAADIILFAMVLLLHLRRR
jgi:hypothetical protein